MKTRQKFLNAGLLFIVLVLVNYLASSVPWTVDLTANHIYTLTPGTKKILKKIEDPITLNLYYNGGDVEGLRLPYKNYATRVKEMLRQYARDSDGKIKFRVIDPQPDSDAEEAATRAGLNPQGLQNGSKFYFGLVATQAAQEKKIPFFALARESFLEYDISKLIYDIQLLNKPHLGLITSLPLEGGYNPMQRGASQSQIVVDEWKSSYKVVPIQASADKLPADLDELAIIHPENLSQKLLFAIDQFVLSGKPVFIAVDPHSRYFASRSHSRYPGQQQPYASSDLPTLFKAWGIDYSPSKILCDLDLATTVQTNAGRVDYPAWLSLTQSQFNSKAMPTSNLKSMLLVSPGSFSLSSKSKLKLTPLLTSSKNSGYVNAAYFGFMQPGSLAQQVKPDGKSHVLAGLLTGTFRTAFPDGPPKEKSDSDKTKAKSADAKGADKTKDSTKSTDAKSKSATAKATYLTKSSKPGRVIIVADTDWILDQYSVQRIQFLNAVQPLNDNLSFASNCVDFLGGSDALISIRGKGTSIHPFTVIRRMEVAAQQQYDQEQKAVQNQLSDVQKKLSELLAGRSSTKQLVLTPDVQASIRKYQTKEAGLKSELRQIRKALRKNIARLENNLILVNLLIIPVLILIFGVWFFVQRFRHQRS